MRIFILFFLVLIASCSTNEVTKKQTNSSFILTNVSVVDVENKTILPSKTLVIKKGEIDSIIDQTVSLPHTNLKIIDGREGYVTPGLIDMHVHMYEKASYILTLNHGVTHVRIMNGVPKQLLWRDNIESGLQIGSSSTVSSPIVSGYKDATLHHFVETAEEAKAAVKKYQSQGYDLIKAYGSLNETALSAIAEEGKKLGMPIAKHGPHASGDMDISALTGFQSFEHVEDIYQGPLNHEFAPERIPEIVSALKATNVPVTPTLNTYYQLTKLSLDKEDYLATTSPEYTSDIIAFEASTNQVKRWLNASDKMAAHNQKTLKFLQQITMNLHESGVPLLVGSDSGVILSPHGLATHNEMRLLEEAGLSTFDVLVAATLTPAKALNLAHQIGKVSKGYKADFIYSLSDPIKDLSVLIEPEAVIKNGHWYSRETLNAMKDEAIESRSFWEEFLVLWEAL
ncbi:amidohydrolase family protein [Colwelliaceae bacterium 6471]